MSIHYLLDGYNVIYQMPPVLNLTELEDRRRHLIRFIERHAPQGSPNNRVTIVFDGDAEVFGGMASPAAKIVFSRGESADDKIKKIVAQAQNTKNMVVVTDDRDIQYAVRALGAKAIGVQTFLSKAGLAGKEGRAARKKGSGRTKRGPTEEKYIPESDEFKITAELERVWLKPGNGTDG